MLRGVGESLLLKAVTSGSCVRSDTGLVLTRCLNTVSGEIFELKAELNNEKKEKRKEAVKKVIAAMTVGKDVR